MVIASQGYSSKFLKNERSSLLCHMSKFLVCRFF